MLEMSPRKIFILLIFITSLVFLRFTSLIHFSQSEIKLEKGVAINIANDEILSQKFKATRNGLGKISFIIKASRIKKGDKVKMYLADETCQKNLREGLLLGSFIKERNVYEFKFKKIDDSLGQTYCIKALFESKNKEAKPVSFFTTKHKHFDFLATNITTGQKANNHISIRPAYRNENIFQDLNELNQRISQYKPWFLKQHFLTSTFILFLSCSSGVIFLLIKKIT